MDTFGTRAVTITSWQTCVLLLFGKPDVSSFHEDRARSDH